MGEKIEKMVENKKFGKIRKTLEKWRGNVGKVWGKCGNYPGLSALGLDGMGLREWKNPCGIFQRKFGIFFFPGGAAMRAGVQEGDRIVKVSIPQIPFP